MGGTALLEAQGLTKRFGALAAVDGIDLIVEPGQIHGLVGPNGAGKTTLFNLLSGFLRPDIGRVIFNGADVTHHSPNVRARRGLVRTFQNIRLFGGLTVEQNVWVGQEAVHVSGALRGLWPIPTARSRSLQREANGLIDRFHLGEYRKRRASTLPYGVQKRLEMARALAGHPKLLLLDEPVAGMNATETEEVIEQIRGVAGEGVTVLLVEHDMQMVMTLCHVVTVVNFGRTIASGSPGSVQQDPGVREAYLGRE